MAGPDNWLAFVLAHEMGHQLARHHAEKLSVEVIKSWPLSAMWLGAATYGVDVLSGVVLSGALFGRASHATPTPFQLTLCHNLRATQLESTTLEGDDFFRGYIEQNAAGA